MDCFYRDQCGHRNLTSPVLLVCDCLIAICQECAKRELLITFPHERHKKKIIPVQNEPSDAHYEAFLSCPQCSCTISTSRHNIISGVENALVAEEMLLKAAMTEVDMSYFKHSANLVDLERCWELLNGDEKVEAIPTEALLPEATRVAKLRKRIAAAMLAEHSYYDNPLDSLSFKTNRVLENFSGRSSGSASNAVWSDTECNICTNAIRPGYSVQLTCACNHLMCRDCVLKGVHYLADTYHSGVHCPMCRAASPGMLQNTHTIAKFENLLIKSGRNYITNKLLTFRDSAIDENERTNLLTMVKMYWCMGYEGNIDVTVEQEKTASLHRLRLEVAKLEEWRLNACGLLDTHRLGCDTADVSKAVVHTNNQAGKYPVSFLHALKVSKNTFFEHYYLHYSSGSATHTPVTAVAVDAQSILQKLTKLSSKVEDRLDLLDKLILTCMRIQRFTTPTAVTIKTEVGVSTSSTSNNKSSTTGSTGGCSVEQIVTMVLNYIKQKGRRFDQVFGTTTVRTEHLAPLYKKITPHSVQPCVRKLVQSGFVRQSLSTAREEVYSLNEDSLQRAFLDPYQLRTEHSDLLTPLGGPVAGVAASSGGSNGAHASQSPTKKTSATSSTISSSTTSTAQTAHLVSPANTMSPTRKRGRKTNLEKAIALSLETSIWSGFYNSPPLEQTSSSGGGANRTPVGTTSLSRTSSGGKASKAVDAERVANLRAMRDARQSRIKAAPEVEATKQRYRMLHGGLGREYYSVPHWQTEHQSDTYSASDSSSESSYEGRSRKKTKKASTPKGSTVSSPAPVVSMSTSADYFSDHSSNESSSEEESSASSGSESDGSEDNSSTDDPSDDPKDTSSDSDESEHSEQSEHSTDAEIAKMIKTLKEAANDAFKDAARLKEENERLQNEIAAARAKNVSNLQTHKKQVTELNQQIQALDKQVLQQQKKTEADEKAAAQALELAEAKHMQAEKSVAALNEKLGTLNTECEQYKVNLADASKQLSAKEQANKELVHDVEKIKNTNIRFKKELSELTRRLETDRKAHTVALERKTAEVEKLEREITKKKAESVTDLNLNGNLTRTYNNLLKQNELIAQECESLRKHSQDWITQNAQLELKAKSEKRKLDDLIDKNAQQKEEIEELQSDVRALKKERSDREQREARDNQDIASLFASIQP